MKADIIAFSGNKIISRLIRWVTKSDINHVAIMVGDNVLMETAWNGVRLRRLKESEKNYKILRYEGLTYGQKKGISCFVLNSVKTKYDYKLFFGIGLNLLFGLDTKWNNKNRYICAQLILKAYKSVGINLVPGYSEHNIIPDDIIKADRLKVVKYK